MKPREAIGRHSELLVGWAVKTADDNGANSGTLVDTDGVIPVVVALVI